MRVCVLYDDESYGFTPAAFLKKFDWEMVLLHRPVMDRLRSLARENRFDVYFNLCDGASDEDYPGVDVVQALEELNIPYTGADSKFYDPTREVMQAAADANGVGFAKGFHVTEKDDLESIVKNLRFPLMVKHPKSYSSIGMTRDSRVDDLDHLRTQFKRIASEFGSARVEEFIVGREFNVLIVDDPDNMNTPFVYPPTELIFPSGDEFWHTDIKWDYSVKFEFRQVQDPALVVRLQDAGRRMFLVIKGTGYGRCDVRMNAGGEIFILEINPNGGILYTPEEYGPADYMILYDKDGYDGFFDRIFRSAIVRQKMREAKRIK